MELNKLRDNWNTFGQKDPLWSILTDATKKGNRWELEEFFKTGQEEIGNLFQYLDAQNIQVKPTKALDFGCGVGRLTQALSHKFEEVHGVDIAESMIDLAKEYNQQGNACQYHVNVKADLSLFESSSFSFIYSSIVLQHMKPDYAKRYLLEFLRLLSPDGVLVFQIPSALKRKSPFRHHLRRLLPSSIFNAFVKWKDGVDAIIEMYCIEKQEVIDFINSNNAKILDVCEDQSTGEDWVSYRYIVQLKSSQS